MPRDARATLTMNGGPDLGGGGAVESLSAPLGVSVDADSALGFSTGDSSLDFSGVGFET